MARIKIADLPLLEEMSQEELQRLYGEGLFPTGRLRQMTAALALGVGLTGGSMAYGRGGTGSHGGHPGQHAHSGQTGHPGSHPGQHPGHPGQHPGQHPGHPTPGAHGTHDHGHAPRRLSRNRANWRRHWNARHGTWVYFDPDYACNYCWDPGQNCYTLLDDDSGE